MAVVLLNVFLKIYLMFEVIFIHVIFHCFSYVSKIVVIVFYTHCLNVYNKYVYLIFYSAMCSNTHRKRQIPHTQSIFQT